MDYLTNFLAQTFLFKGITAEECKEYLYLLNPKICEYQREQIVYAPDNFGNDVGFIISGKCVVKKLHNDGSFVELNVLTRGGAFGIISALSNVSDYPTHVIAKSTCKILFLTKNDLLTLIRSSPDVALNTVCFLADRILFLNNKVTTFTSGSCEKKLATELLSKAKALGQSILPFNKKRTAEAICCGRASLYRSLEALKCEGIIDYDNKNIFINDLEGLERITK